MKSGARLNGTRLRSSNQRLLRAFHVPGTGLNMEDVEAGAQALSSQRLHSSRHSTLVPALLHFVDERENKAQERK